MLSVSDIIVTPAIDLADVYYVICSDVDKLFMHTTTHECYIQISLHHNGNKHPDQIVQDLVAQLNDYEIVTDKNYD